jgi:hypothetical protein
MISFFFVLETPLYNSSSPPQSHALMHQGQSSLYQILDLPDLTQGWFKGYLGHSGIFTEHE